MLSIRQVESIMLYDTIGKTYSQTRQSDPRITAKLLEILEPFQASTIVDIGAGTGSYALYLAEHRYQVLAVEPSTVMRRQAIAHPAVRWIDAKAEHLSLPSHSADVAIIILALHHFPDYSQALQEIHRVTGGGQVVIFTYDPDLISSFWLTEYFPSFIADVQSTFVPIATLTAEIETLMDTAVNIVPFPLPNDLSDSFAAVGWGCPELYLEHNIRNGISSFTKLNEDKLEQGLSSLCNDLETGIWDQKHEYLRQKTYYDVGYRFVYTSKRIRPKID